MWHLSQKILYYNIMNENKKQFCNSLSKIMQSAQEEKLIGNAQKINDKSMNNKHQFSSQ